jgi:hypothetical protein
MINILKEVFDVYSMNHIKPINTPCRQNAELLSVKAGGMSTFVALKYGGVMMMMTMTTMTTMTMTTTTTTTTMKWKGSKSNRSWHNFRYYISIFL